MTKLDLKKEQRHLYAPRAGEIGVVDVPAMNFLMVDGAGDPNGNPAYVDAVTALFSVSYTLKFALKCGGQDYAVMPLEGLWWADDWGAFLGTDRAGWRWTMMIRQPDFVTPEQVQEAVRVARQKKPLPALDGLRFESFAEGKAAQLLHIGPYSEEGPNIQRLHAFIEQRGQLSGKHHEIYLSDIRKAAPERWKTVLRQPMTEGQP
ncbi:GyrI-like domain-containing protein [Deinococcus sp. VB343]|uniref:GyrI-like domain-containing protein n=1 Tax=Deinococcus sp. VB142 TaxID=3112952 RepID=A0AAU6PYK6_9DEIO